MIEGSHYEKCRGWTDKSSPLSRERLPFIRHELRTPINHIIGYSEMLLEELEEQSLPVLKSDLEKVRIGGRQLLSLINDFFDPENIERRKLDVTQIYHELRTPVNQIIGYSELLQEEASDAGLATVLPDLDKIYRAALHWLRLMESHLLTPGEMPVDVPRSVVTQEDHVRLATNIAVKPQVRKTKTHVTGTLLVVDDDPTNREMLSRRLHKQGFGVSIAKTGLQALELLCQKAFDLVLLDILMPGINGYEVLKQMKSDPLLQSIPVIMISALDDLDGIVRCIESGAEDYIAKPFNPVFLNARIGAALEKKRLRDQEKVYLEQIEQEKAKSDRLLLNVLPVSIAERLRGGESSIAEHFDSVSVIFADLVGFTALSMQVKPAEMVKLLNGIFSTFDSLAGKHGLEKIKTIGDAYMAVAGLPEASADHAEAAAEMALDMLSAIALMNRVQGTNLGMRIGIHSGPVVAGIIGTRKFAYDLWGDTVNTASRMESHGQGGRIHVSQATAFLLDGKYVIESRGAIDIKGKGEMCTSWLAGRL